MVRDGGLSVGVGFTREFIKDKKKDTGWKARATSFNAVERT